MPDLKNTFRYNKPVEPRTVQVKIYLTDSEVEILEYLSNQLHLPRGEMIRTALAEYLDNNVMNII